MNQGIVAITAVLLLIVGGSYLRRHEDSKWAMIAVGLSLLLCILSFTVLAPK